MAKEGIDGTLLRLAVVRVKMSDSDNPERPIGDYKRGDLKIIKNLIEEINREYTDQISVLRSKRQKGTPDFQNIKDNALRDEDGEQLFDFPTRNFYSSVIATYKSLTRSVRRGRLSITLEELRQYSEMFVERPGVA